MFSAHGTFTMFTVQLSSQARVDSGTTSLYRLPVHLGMGIGTSLSSVEFLSFSTFPLGMDWIVARQVTVSPNGNWAESSCRDCHSTNGVCDGIMHCLMLACWPHCKCHTFASVLLWKEIVFCMTSAVGCQSANMC